jgi:hypothetical protein
MSKSQKYEWPPVCFSNNMVRCMNSMIDQSRGVEELWNISGYKADLHQLHNNVVVYLLEEGLIKEITDESKDNSYRDREYTLTEKGRWVTDEIVDLRDLEIMDARNASDNSERSDYFRSSSNLEWESSNPVNDNLTDIR